VVCSLLFFFPMIVAGGAASAVYRLFPAVLGLSASASSLILGAIAGGVLAALLRLIWKSLFPVWFEENAEIRFVNSFIAGLGATLIGIVFHFALGIAFPSGSAVRVAQGFLLIGSTLVGLRIGFSLVGPIWRTGEGSQLGAQDRLHRASGGKLLDTSIIIDGRIGGLLSTGFVEGEILVPEFVLAELQNIADSSNSLRRRKGRRGLDILNELMQDERVSIRVLTKDYPSIREVDRKLIRLAKDESATLVTTDFNLNRVAQVEGVPILNVNELANAVKPQFIPGEGISIEIIDRGEEINQGIGYLDDGTMVVVENGRRHIGRTIKATVKSALQTEAGRMLFVEPSGEAPRWER
jgi:rRNA-processing protein FCF1